MTAVENVLDYLRTSNDSYTNAQLANILAIPEPSVRRATLKLERRGRIHVDQTREEGQRLFWKALV